MEYIDTTQSKSIDVFGEFDFYHFCEAIRQNENQWDIKKENVQ